MSDLDELIKMSRAKVEAMSPEEYKEMARQQGESYARAESSWPAPKFKMVNGVKVYESYSDYCND